MGEQPAGRARLDQVAGQGPVLVGWDGSAGAETALETAVRLWPRRHFVLTTVDIDADPPPARIGEPEMSVHRVHSRHAGFVPAVAGALVTAAREHGAAVTVLGSRGRSAIREIVLGSVAMSTLHQAHRLVMVVPRHRRNAAEPDS
jgi:nucleotide-binding universal stress UspA family protein